LRSLPLFLLLVAFWAALSGTAQTHHAFLAISGLATCALVTWLAIRKGLQIRDWSPLQKAVVLVRYLPWLLWQIVRANWRVIHAVWSPTLPIDPRMVEVPCTLKTSLGRALYANSITLTPGTVTVDIKATRFTVHALTKQDGEDLLNGEMHQHIDDLEPDLPS